MKDLDLKEIGVFAGIVVLGGLLALVAYDKFVKAWLQPKTSTVSVTTATA
jgi:hypothetical protein